MYFEVYFSHMYSVLYLVFSWHNLASSPTLKFTWALSLRITLSCYITWWMHQSLLNHMLEYFLYYKHYAQSFLQSIQTKTPQKCMDSCIYTHTWRHKKTALTFNIIWLKYTNNFINNFSPKGSRHVSLNWKFYVHVVRDEWLPTFMRGKHSFKTAL